MPAREAYARATVSLRGVECSPGVEIRPGDDVDEMTHDIQFIATEALREFGGNHMELEACVEACITDLWPGRAYFVETEEEGRGVQVFSPYELPRNPPTLGCICLSYYEHLRVNCSHPCDK